TTTTSASPSPATRRSASTAGGVRTPAASSSSSATARCGPSRPASTCKSSWPSRRSAAARSSRTSEARRGRPMRYRLALLALALPAVGCGGGPKVAPVSGRVTLDGQPLAGASVNFQPLSDGNNLNPGPGSYGKTDADGRYSLRVVVDDRPGAFVGKHRVEI